MTPPHDAYFRATRQGGVIHLAGCVTQSSECELIVRELADSNTQVYDLENLLPSPWLGLRDLYDAIVGHSNHVTVTNAPEQMFRHLKLIDVHARRIHFDRPYVPLLTSDSTIRVDLGKITVSDTGVVSYLDQELLGLLSTIQPSPTVDSMPSAMEAFASKYAQFVYTTIELSGGIIESIVLELTEILTSFHSVVSAYDAEFKKLVPTHTPTALSVKAFADQIEQILHTPREIIASVKSELLSIMREGRPNVGDGGQSPIDSLLKLPSIVDDAARAADTMEAQGTIIGDRILKIESDQRLRESFAQIEGQTLRGDRLVEFRKNLAILGFANEDDWPATCADIRSEFANLRRLRANFGYALQNFDFARQIMDHRMAELEAIKATVTAGTEDIEALAAELHERIVQRMVTDQETMAYSYFFPEERAACGRGQSIPRNEVLLF